MQWASSGRLGCRDLAGFNFASSEVSRALLDQLRGCAFLEALTMSFGWQPRRHNAPRPSCQWPYASRASKA
jgi:hypothetical protein